MKIKKYYQSLTMGNLVEKITGRKGVIHQVIESLFRYHTLDLKWRVYYDTPCDTQELRRKIDYLLDKLNIIIKNLENEGE